MSTDTRITFTMGALGTVSDGRYVIAVIQTLRTAMRALDSGKLTDLTKLISADPAKRGHPILHNAVLYSGLQHRHIYTLSEYIYALFLKSGAAPTKEASNGMKEIDCEALAKADLGAAKHVVREALYSLTDTIKFDANVHRMA